MTLSRTGAITLDGVALPRDLVWSDEHSWTPYEQTIEYTVTGVMINEVSVSKKAGRTISLSGGANWGWVTFETMENIRQKIAVAPPVEMTLHFKGKNYTVRWNWGGVPLSGTPLFPNRLKYNNFQLQFIEV